MSRFFSLSRKKKRKKTKEEEEVEIEEGGRTVDREGVERMIWRVGRKKIKKMNGRN